VRASLQLVKRGEATPQQALTAVVHKLAEELTNTQFQSLINYFKNKQAQGSLVPAKQLLLHCLQSARVSTISGPAQQQHQQQQQQQQQLANNLIIPHSSFDKSSFSTYSTIGSSQAQSLQAAVAALDQGLQFTSSTLSHLDAAPKQQQLPALPDSSKAATWRSTNQLHLAV